MTGKGRVQPGMKPLGKENGSAIFAAMIMRVLLTLIGISSTNTSSSEALIAANNPELPV
jgi:Tfp pilus assembly protein PilX